MWGPPWPQVRPCAEHASMQQRSCCPAPNRHAFVNSARCQQLLVQGCSASGACSVGVVQAAAGYEPQVTCLCTLACRASRMPAVFHARNTTCFSTSCVLDMLLSCRSLRWAGASETSTVTSGLTAGSHTRRYTGFVRGALCV
jgi:hypothetical protein